MLPFVGLLLCLALLSFTFCVLAHTWIVLTHYKTLYKTAKKLFTIVFDLDSFHVSLDDILIFCKWIFHACAFVYTSRLFFITLLSKTRLGFTYIILRLIAFIVWIMIILWVIDYATNEDLRFTVYTEVRYTIMRDLQNFFRTSTSFVSTVFILLTVGGFIIVLWMFTQRTSNVVDSIQKRLEDRPAPEIRCVEEKEDED